MPTNRRQRRKVPRQGRVLTPEIRQILSTGIDFSSDLDRFEPIPRDRYGHIVRNFRGDDATPGSDGRIDFLRAQWAKHKDEVMKWHIDKWRDGSRPWAWWVFDSPEPYPLFLPCGGRYEDHAAAQEKQRIEAVAILVRHNLLTPAEEAKIRQQNTDDAAMWTGSGTIEDD